MPLIHSSTSPAVNQAGYFGTQTNPGSSNSFTPPAGSVIVVTAVSADSFNNDWATAYPTITDSLTTHLTWNLVKAQFDNALGTTSTNVAVWWAYTPTAPGSMDVTVTESATTGQYVTYIGTAVDVWTGANPSNPIGTVVAGNATSNATLSVAVTPKQIGSALMLAGGANAATTVPAAGSGCYANNSGTNLPFASVWSGTSGGPTLTTSLSPVTLSQTISPATTWEYVAYEVMPAWAYIGANTYEVNGSASQVVTLPSGVNGGDLIVVSATMFQSGTPGVTCASLTTQYDQACANSGSHWGYCATRIAAGTAGSGTSDTTFTLTFGGGTSSWGMVNIYVLRSTNGVAYIANKALYTDAAYVTSPLTSPSLTVAGPADATIYGYGGVTSAANETFSAFADSSLANPSFYSGATGEGCLAGIAWGTGVSSPAGATYTNSGGTGLDQFNWGLDVITQAISVDASTPVDVKVASTTSASEATASFSPPAGSTVVICVGIQFDSNTTTTPTWTVADSLSNAYAAGPTAFDGEAAGVYMFSHYYATAPGSITVTATRAVQLGAAMFYVKTWVLDGTAGTTGATASTHATTGTTMTTPIIPTYLNSWVMGGVSVGSDETLTAVGLITDSTYADSGDGSTAGAGHANSDATTSETIGWTGGNSSTWSLALMEVLALGTGGSGYTGTNGTLGTQAIPGRAQPGNVIPGQVILSGKTVTAGLATASGTAQSPAVLVSPNAGLATATGTAQSPAVLVKPLAAVATAVGTAQSPAVSMTAKGTLASGTGSALSPPVQLTVFAGLATGSGTAQSPGVALTPTLATAAGTAQQPAVSLTVNAGLASGVATSQSPAVSLTVFAGLATGSGTAQSPVAAVASNAIVATGSGTAQSPNPSLTVFAGLATGSGTAQSPNPSITVNAGLATATGTALNATGFPVFASLATGSGTSQSPAVSLTVFAGLATGSGTAQSPTVAEGDTYPAELAPGFGTAQSPAVSLTVFAGLATGSGTAQSPVAHVSPNAGLASGVATSQSPAVLVKPNATVATGTGTSQSPAASLEVNAGLATGVGTSQSPAVKLTAFAGLATGKDTAQQPTVSFGIRHALNLGGSATPLFPYNGSFTEENLGGSVSYGNLLGGSAVPALNWGGSATLASPDTTSGGTATVLSSTLGGTVGYGNTLGGSAIGWTMQQVNLTLAENNDETVDFAVTSNSSALDISTATINVYFKTAAGVIDSSALMFSSGGGSPAITITNGPGGLCTLAIPHADLYPETYTFYRLDVVFAGLQNTAIYGNITWVTL